MLICRLLLLLASAAGGLAQGPAAAPAPAAAAAGEAPAPAPAPAPAAEPLPDPLGLGLLELTPDLVLRYTQANGQGTLYASCRSAGSTRKCDPGDNTTARMHCCGFASHGQEWLGETCTRFDRGECPRGAGREGGPCRGGAWCIDAAKFTCCQQRPWMGGRIAVQVPTCQRPALVDITTGGACSVDTMAYQSLAELAAAAAPQPVPLAQVPDLSTLAAYDLDFPLVNGTITAANGRGTRFALSRLPEEAGGACDPGLVQCFMIQAATGPGDQLQGVCVPPGECPWTYPGVEGGPCGVDRQCGPGLACCESRPLAGGLTEGLIPTCQAGCPDTPAACTRLRQEEFEEEAAVLLGARDPANHCEQGAVTECRPHCVQAMQKLGHECVVQLRGASWTAEAMDACNVTATDLTPCAMEMVPLDAQARWGPMLAACPAAVPRGCICETAGDACLNALYWLGHRCAKWLSSEYGVAKKDAYWRNLGGATACPFAVRKYMLSGPDTSQPPCKFEAPTPQQPRLRWEVAQQQPQQANTTAQPADGLAAGAVAGIVVGAAAAAAAAALSGWAVYRRRRLHPQHGSAGGQGSAAVGFALLGSAAGSSWLSDPASDTKLALSRQGAAGEPQDPLLAYLRSRQAPSRSRHSGSGSRASSSSIRAHGSGGVDVAPWELPFSELVFLGVLGEGSFGRVFLAEWHRTTVAAKVLLAPCAVPPAAASGAGAAAAALRLPADVLAKLEEEARLLASLRHPNCVNFLGFSRDPPCMVTEWCQRGSLMQVLERGAACPQVADQLTWQRRLGMLLDAATGMLYLHTRPSPVLHRDLKSPNLLVDLDWHCKVTDFNLSRVEADARAASSSSVAATNPRWLAPEVLVGRPASPASDVYSFGIVMWECLCWRLPWGRGDPWHIVGAVLHGKRPELPPAEELPGLGAAGRRGLPAYLALLQRCWAQEAAGRPTFDGVVDGLRSQLDAASEAPANNAPASEPPAAGEPPRSGGGSSSP